MAEDSFIREVNEDVRQERISAFWHRYGSVLIGGAIAIVLGTAVFQGYSAWVDRKAARIGDSFLEISDISDASGYDAVLAKLDEIEKSGFGAYPALAEMRRASVLVAQDNKAGAVAVFDAVAANPSTPRILKDMASVRAAYILVDTGLFEDVEKRVKSLASDIDPMRFAARETLGFAAWKAGRIEDAVYYFGKIREDKGVAGEGFYQRADMMLNLIRGRRTQTEG